MNLGSTKRIAEIYQKHENKIKIAIGVVAVGVVGFLITKMLLKKRNEFVVHENIDIDKLRENGKPFLPLAIISNDQRVPFPSIDQLQSGDKVMLFQL